MIRSKIWDGRESREIGRWFEQYPVSFALIGFMLDTFQAAGTDWWCSDRLKIWVRLRGMEGAVVQPHFRFYSDDSL